MAIRKIRTMGDRILNKVCRPVEEMTPKLRELVEDMLETMYDAYGVGLAAPQVGMLKRIVVIDVGDENGPYVLINPAIKETSGEQTGEEGCPIAEILSKRIFVWVAFPLPSRPSITMNFALIFVPIHFYYSKI